ncbi:MAG: hypothetical protein HYX92_03440 [Chloroflexi bacterium]|nr:hypothetical protein [Chloroflexota bacterium]
MPAIVIAVPGWHAQAVRSARSYGMSEKRIIELPLGNIFGDSTEAIPIIRDSASEVTDQIARALREPVLAGRLNRG